MKRKPLILLLLLVSITLCAMNLIGCGTGPSQTGGLTFKTLTVEGTNVYGKVGNDCSAFFLFRRN